MDCKEYQARMAETNNHKQGRSGGKCKVVSGPAAGVKQGNPTSAGGINRSARGTSQH